MKREIKFRGYNNERKIWLVGDLSYNNEKYYVIPQALCNETIYFPYYEAAPDSIGQYTGRRDVDGKEIYEGDIVQFSESVADYVQETYRVEVSYDEDTNGFYPLYDYQLYDFEVIGNVYENKELLNQ